MFHFKIVWRPEQAGDCAVPRVTTVPQAIDTEEDIVFVLSSLLISKSLSVGLEPKETSVIRNSPSPRRLFAPRSTRGPDTIGGSVGTVSQASLPEPEETSILAPTLPATQAPVPVHVSIATRERTHHPQIHENVAEIPKATVASLPSTTVASVSLELPSLSSNTPSSWTPILSTQHCEALLNLSWEAQQLIYVDIDWQMEVPVIVVLLILWSI